MIAFEKLLFFLLGWVVVVQAQQTTVGTNTTATLPLLATISPAQPCVTLCFPNRTLTSTSTQFSTLPLVTTTVTTVFVNTTTVTTTATTTAPTTVVQVQTLTLCPPDQPFSNLVFSTEIVSATTSTSTFVTTLSSLSNSTTPCPRTTTATATATATSTATAVSTKTVLPSNGLSIL